MNKKNIVTVLGWIFVAIVVAFAFVGRSKNIPATTEIYTMNTVADIKIYGKNKKVVLQKVVEEINKINELVDDFSPDSDVYKINENAGIKAISVHPETLDMVKKAVEVARLTNGSFDPAIRPLSEIWGFKNKNYRIPSEESIKDTLKLINYNDIVINKNTIFLKKKGEGIDLGGIAKGYTLDCIKTILEEMHAERAIINMGGNVLTYGNASNGYWRIGIKNPRGDGIIGILKVKGTTFISTSGDYERFFIKNGKRYCHIIDPYTGYPANRIVSVTVLSNKGYIGDALSTAFFVMGKDEALRNAKKLGVNIIGVDKNLKLFFTKDMEKSFVPER